MELNHYMEQGIGSIMQTVSRFYLTNIRGLRFLTKVGPALKKSSNLRKEKEKQGLHIPPFLIASIASSCNLHCSGCYARADGMCADSQGQDMDTENWKQVFAEASELGVSFILLAGGEPLLKPEVIETAASFKNMIFPVFTNGLLLEQHLEFFDTNRNMVPVISIEGDSRQTDQRRGNGIADKISGIMNELKKRGVLFAVSITVTSENVHNITKDLYMKELRDKGCGVVFYVEYVPMENETDYLVLNSRELEQMTDRILHLKKQCKDMVLLSFPGDEQLMGGCLAAGRGFFHISPTGAAEPCPFSPFSQMNVKDQNLKEVLQSQFFRQVREIEGEAEEHFGGCTLFRYEEKVKHLIEKEVL